MPSSCCPAPRPSMPAPPSYGIGAEACDRTSPDDLFGTARPQGSAPDIGAYEGTGYTPNPTGEFDTLTNTVSGNTVIVKNTKWKLVWDMARGGGITGFYDMTGDTTANLVAREQPALRRAHRRLPGLHPDLQYHRPRLRRAHPRPRRGPPAPGPVRLPGPQCLLHRLSPPGMSISRAKSPTSPPAPWTWTRSNTSSRWAPPPPSPSPPAACPASTTGTDTAILNYRHPGRLPLGDPGPGRGRGLHGDLEPDRRPSPAPSTAWASRSPTWPISAKNMSRHHHFLLYVGDVSLDNDKASTLNADAYNPSPVTMSAGSLLHERSWQDGLGGHWTFDEGSGHHGQGPEHQLHQQRRPDLDHLGSGKVGGACASPPPRWPRSPTTTPWRPAGTAPTCFWVKPDFSAMGATPSSCPRASPPPTAGISGATAGREQHHVPWMAHSVRFARPDHRDLDPYRRRGGRRPAYSTST